MNYLPTHSNYNCKIISSDGQESFVHSNWLHNQNLDNWQGWHCQAGTQRLCIDKDLMVFSGECRNDFLGSALGDFELLDNGTICSRATCTGCTDDLAVAKQKSHTPQ
jgi:hypothetical protein